MNAHEFEREGLRLGFITFHVLVLTLALAAPSMAQVDTPAVPPAPTPTPAPTPIPASEIATRAGSVRDLVRGVESAIVPDDGLIEIQQAFPGEQNGVAELTQQTDELLQNRGQLSQIKETEKTTVRMHDRLERWMGDLSSRSGELESTLGELQDEREVWELTRDAEREDRLPGALMDQVSEAIEVLRGGEEQVRAARDAVLALQAGVAQQQNLVDELLVRQRAEITERSVGIFGADSPPLWRAFGAVADEGASVIDQIEAMVELQIRDVRGYVAERGPALVIWLLLWAGLAAMLILMRSKATVWVQQDQSLEKMVAMLDRPLAAAAVVTLPVVNIVNQQAPTAWIDLVNLLLLLALVLLLLRVLSKSLRPVPYLMIALYVLLRTVQLAPAASITQRLAMLVLSLAGIACCWWFLRVLRTDPDHVPEAWLPWVVRGVRLAIGMLAVSMLANFTGSVRLGELLVVGTVDAVLIAIGLVVVTVLLQSLVRVALLSKTARHLGIAPDHSDAVRRVLFRTIALLVTVFWVVFTLKGFTLYDPVIAKIGAVLQAEASIGDFSISLGDVLIVVFIIWLSVKLAALVEFILEVIVLPRVELPVGVPQTISRSSRYIVILIGVVIAFSAIGFDISQAALVAGGLGVGIGFGLQNVVNNFASGLILLFERPIRIGDIIELDSASGVVEEIGLRATLIRTWRGSELIVPNATLISSDVVNWTLKRDRRRAEISVGVGHDSDPEVVAELLIDVARAHSEVLKHPEPQCRFLGFGDSSLDFKLLAWAAAGDCDRVESELRFAVRRALTDAGIGIAVPQRDLHVRTTASDSRDDEAGESSAVTAED